MDFQSDLGHSSALWMERSWDRGGGVSMGAAADGGGADTAPRELIQRLQRKFQPLARLQVRPGDSELKSH